MKKRLQKRVWCYVQQPSSFDIPPCSCGNKETQWSEYRNHLWCEKCQKDFIPDHWGVLDGPILVGVSELLGISFDRINLKTHKLEVLDKTTFKYKEADEQPTIVQK